MNRFTAYLNKKPARWVILLVMSLEFACGVRALRTRPQLMPEPIAIEAQTA